MMTVPDDDRADTDRVREAAATGPSMTSSAPTSPPPVGAARLRRTWAVVAGVLAVAGVVLVAVALAVPVAPPPPSPQPQAVDAAVGPTTGVPVPPSPAPGVVLARSVPVRLDVAGIGVHSPLLTLGLNPDNSVAVPPLEKDSKAGWFEYSPTPGELGPAVLLGHVDSAQYGPGVFHRLGELRPGQMIAVTRSDQTVAEFEVYRVEAYPKSGFPSLQVYGNTADAQLRLITCGGVFDAVARSYESNIVAYARLVSTHPA